VKSKGRNPFAYLIYKKKKKKKKKKLLKMRNPSSVKKLVSKAITFK